MIEFLLLMAFVVLLPWVLSKSTMTLLFVSVILLHVIFSAKGFLIGLLCAIVILLNYGFRKFYKAQMNDCC